jgi:hypothetical protein
MDPPEFDGDVLKYHGLKTRKFSIVITIIIKCCVNVKK